MMTRIFIRNIQCALLMKQEINPCNFAYGAVNLCGISFQKFQLVAQDMPLPKSTSPLPYGSGFRLPCSVFSRPYWQNLY